jgi:hypothetical protein
VQLKTNLIIETTLLVEEVEELHVGFASPQVHVGDFEVTPDCSREEGDDVIHLH